MFLRLNKLLLSGLLTASMVAIHFASANPVNAHPDQHHHFNDSFHDGFSRNRRYGRRFPTRGFRRGLGRGGVNVIISPNRGGVIIRNGHRRRYSPYRRYYRSGYPSRRYPVIYRRYH